MSDEVKTVNALVETAHPLGCESLYAVGVVNGQVVRFKVIAFSRSEPNELELQLERCSWEGPGT